jgi:hypothetical protein
VLKKKLPGGDVETKNNLNAIAARRNCRSAGIVPAVFRFVILVCKRTSGA